MSPYRVRFAATNFSVYRFYAEDGHCLYVGLTANGINRLKQHSLTQSWWTQVASVGVEHFGDEAEANTRERYLIGQLQPEFNRQARPVPAPPVLPEMAA